MKKGGEGMERRFFWGTAVSAYQVEGGNDQWSDWGRWKVKAGRACDFWNRYEYYLDLAKKLGTNAFRFSIEWARVEPKEGRWNDDAFGHYQQMIKAMLDRGLEPFVTLWHFTLPQWIAEKGGWSNFETVEYFLRYIRKVAEYFYGSVHYWIVVNEPSVVFGSGYLNGKFPPGCFLCLGKYFAARRNLKQAVLKATDILHDINSEFIVGSAFALSILKPARLWNPIDWLVVRLVHRFSDFEFIAEVYPKLDFIGLNYYMRQSLGITLLPRIKANLSLSSEVSDLGWEIFPEGLGIILEKLYKRFRKPLIVTENGIADSSDRLRPEFIKNHLAALKIAKARGVDVRGYFHWSLIDNFEWSHGFGPRFGLFEMDYSLFEAKERKSAAVYATLIKEHS